MQSLDRYCFDPGIRQMSSIKRDATSVAIWIGVFVEPEQAERSGLLAQTALAPTREQTTVEADTGAEPRSNDR